MLFEGRRAVGVRTAAGVEKADAIVMNADFARAMQRLVPDRLRRRWSDRKIARKKFSCSTFMMYLGVEGDFDLPHHNIHIAADYARNLDEIENQHVLSDDPSFYVQNACVTDPTLAPRGMSALYVLAPVTHQHPNVDWSRERERFRAKMLRQIAKAGFTDVERRIRFERSHHAGRLGSQNTRFTRARPSTSRTASTRCCIFVRTTVLRMSMASTLSAAARIRAAVCR